MGSIHSKEIEEGSRFSFGENWSKFILLLDDQRIQQAENSLCEMLNLKDLKGKTFLDVGSGSGLFSLVARRLGATVKSFDYDPKSVACTAELKKRYFPNDSSWDVEQGSVLDSDYLKTLGTWDIVYSWGVLHHTGNMSQALTNVSSLVQTDGKLFIAIYNDQGRSSKNWLKVKKLYNKLPRGFRWIILWPATLRLWGPTIIRDSMKRHPFRTWRNYPKESMRGMSAWRDVVDWVGGLPFEVAKPEEIIHYFQSEGFQIEKLRTCAGGLGCNEFVFLKRS